MNNNLFIDTKLPKPLKKEELDNLFEKMKLGDMNARDLIINHNIRLVIKIVTQKYSNYNDLEELVSIGLIGLIKSVDTFDNDKGTKFTSYATRCINNEIIMFFRKENKNINIMNIDDEIGTNGENGNLKIDEILYDANADFAKQYEDNETYKIIRNVVEQLSGIEKDIILKCCGFINDEPMSLAEFGRELGLSRFSASNIFRRALKRVNVQLEMLGIVELSTIKKDKSSKWRENMPKKTNTIYEFFNKYTKEQVDEMLSKLSCKDRLLIEHRYNNDLDNQKYDEWNEKKSNKFYGNLVPKMKKLLDNPDYQFKTRTKKENPILKVEKEEDIPNVALEDNETKEIEKQDISNVVLEDNETKEFEKQDYIKILELLKTANFGQMLNVLTPKEAIIICLKLGYVDNKYFQTKTISEFLEIDEEEVIECIKKVLLLYKENIVDLIDKAVECTENKQKTLIRKKDNQ